MCARDFHADSMQTNLATKCYQDESLFALDSRGQTLSMVALCFMEEKNFDKSEYKEIMEISETYMENQSHPENRNM